GLPPTSSCPICSRACTAPRWTSFRIPGRAGRSSPPASLQIERDPRLEELIEADPARDAAPPDDLCAALLGEKADARRGPPHLPRGVPGGSPAQRERLFEQD